MRRQGEVPEAPSQVFVVHTFEEVAQAGCVKCGLADTRARFHGSRVMPGPAMNVSYQACRRDPGEHFCLTCRFCGHEGVARRLDGTVIRPADWTGEPTA